MSKQDHALQQIKTLLVQHVLTGNTPTNTASNRDIDPAIFKQLVEEHRLELIINSVNHSVNKSALHSITNHSAPTKRALQKIRRHLQMKQGLLWINQLLKTEQIPYAVLKGIPLNALLYQDTCFRVSGDIDILIHQDDLLAAHDCLIAAGFQLQWALSLQQLLNNASFLHHTLKDLIYKHPAWDFPLELHWHATQRAIAHFKPLKVSHLTDCLVTPKQSIPILEPNRHFLYLCTHAAGHQWQRLQWLVDIAIFYQKIPLDWPVLITLAQEYRATRPLLEACYLLLREYQLRCPTVPHTKRDLIRMRLRLWYAKKLWQNPFPNNYVVVLFNLLLCDSLKDKWRYGINLILMGPRSLLQLLHDPTRSQRKLIVVSVLHKLFKREKALV